MKGVCQFCECTQEHGCADGCAWTDESETLCTRCELAQTFAVATLPVMAALATRAPAKAKDWSQLPREHQTALVMAFRMVADGVRQNFFAALGDEVAEAVVDLAVIASVVYQKFPERMRQADAEGVPVAAVVLELLEKQAESRIVPARRRRRRSVGARFVYARHGHDRVLPTEVICPASDEAGHKATCQECELCRGASRPAKSVVIVAHGRWAAFV